MQLHFFARLGVAIATTLCLLTTPAAHAAKPLLKEPKAIVISVDGKGIAKVRKKSGIESVVGMEQELSPGDRIITDRASVVQIKLIDGSIVRVGFNTEYRIVSATEKEGVLNWVFELTRGTIRALVEKTPPKQTAKFRVNTPSGTMGVRGTELVLEHAADSNQTNLYTIEGKVEFGALDCETKKTCVFVTNGMSSHIAKGEARASKPEKFSLKALTKETLAKDKAAVVAGGGTAMGPGGSGSVGGGVAVPKGGPALTPEELEARLSVLASLGTIGKDPRLLDDEALAKAAAMSSQQLADLQDLLLNRDKLTRAAMENSVKAGTYNDHLALGTGAAPITDGGSESGVNNVSRFKAGSEVIKTSTGGGGSGSGSADVSVAGNADKSVAAKAQAVAAKDASYQNALQTGAAAKASSADAASNMVLAASQKLSTVQSTQKEYQAEAVAAQVAAAAAATKAQAEQESKSAKAKADAEQETAKQVAGNDDQAAKTDTAPAQDPAPDTTSKSDQQNYDQQFAAYNAGLNQMLQNSSGFLNSLFGAYGYWQHGSGGGSYPGRYGNVCSKTQRTCHVEYIGCEALKHGGSCKAGQATREVCENVTVQAPCR